MSVLGLSDFEQTTYLTGRNKLKYRKKKTMIFFLHIYKMS